MSPRAFLPIAFGSFALISLAALAAVLLLQACALPISVLAHLSRCTTPAERVAAQELESARTASLDLQRRIFELEREVAALQCLKAPPDPNAPLDPEDWARGDLSGLYGCWSLDRTYRTRDVDTGAIRSYTGWQMCFDTAGQGRQRMQSTDGIMCEGPVVAQYQGAVLDISEAGNLSCSDGGYIHEREINCTLSAGTSVLCDTVQPETGGEARDVSFARAPTSER